MSFSAVRIDDFDHMAGERRTKEINRTRRFVQEWLTERPRPEFPAVEVRYANKIVPLHIIDHAYTVTRQARHAAGAPRDFDWLAGMSLALPAALESDRARIARLEPLAHLDSNGQRKAGEMARDGLPKELQAPLILEIQTVAF